MHSGGRPDIGGAAAGGGGGLSLRDAVRQAAKELGLSRNELYRLAVEQE